MCIVRYIFKLQPFKHWHLSDWGLCFLLLSEQNLHFNLNKRLSPTKFICYFVSDNNKTNKGQWDRTVTMRTNG